MLEGVGHFRSKIIYSSETILLCKRCLGNAPNSAQLVFSIINKNLTSFYYYYFLKGNVPSTGRGSGPTARRIGMDSGRYKNENVPIEL